jgi:L-threonylcarbamoyladenylate synthase
MAQRHGAVGIFEVMITALGTDVSHAAEVLRSGGVVAIPTETVYGLAASAFEPTAVAKIFEAKNRPFFDPLIVHTDAASRISEYAIGVPDWAVILAEHFWPGALTVVVAKQPIIPDIVTAGLDTVGLRVPNHALTLALLEQLDFPLAAPSANPFGYISPTTARHVQEQLDGKIDYILDGGPCGVGVESTIVAEIEGHPTVLRLGGVTVEQIELVIGPVRISSGPSAVPISPGLLPSHYAPRARVILSAPSATDANAAYLGFSEFSPHLPNNHQRILSRGGDLREAAQAVFAALRELDALSTSTIYAELAPDTGLGRAINDRLRRASAERSPE